MKDSDKILQIKEIYKAFDGVKALNNISFDIQEGTITSIIGPNGAGKTTLFNVINNLIDSDSGEIIFKGMKISKKQTHKIAGLGIARTFQVIRIFPQISVLENILLGTNYKYGESIFHSLFKTRMLLKEEGENKSKSISLLQKVNLSEKENQNAEELSHGQRKLLELIRAIAADADLFLFDEPIAGVFPEVREKIIEIFRELKNNGKTIIFIEHNMEFVDKISDRVIVLDKGKIVSEGKPNQVLNSSKVKKIYFGI